MKIIKNLNLITYNFQIKSKNNLKITEVPVTYYERKEEDTKMTSLVSNTLRMLFIVLTSYYKLRLKK